jgi:hypothetical protein
MLETRVTSADGAAVPAGNPFQKPIVLTRWAVARTLITAGSKRSERLPYHHDARRKEEDTWER